MAKASNPNPRTLAALLGISAYESCVFALEQLVDGETIADTRKPHVAAFDRNMGMINCLRQGEHDALTRGASAVENITHVALPEDFGGVFNDCRVDVVRAREKVDAYLAARDKAEGDLVALEKSARGALRAVKARAGMIAEYRTHVLSGK